MSKGFTVNAVFNRIQALETAAWLNYTALMTLANMKFKTPKDAKKDMRRRLEAQGIKPTKSFDNAASRSVHIARHFYGTAALREPILELGIDEAMQAVIQQIWSHMDDLGVGRNVTEYDKVITYRTKADIPVTDITDAEPEQAEQSGEEQADQPVEESTGATQPHSLADLMAQVMTLSRPEKEALLAFLQSDLGIEDGSIQPIQFAA